VTDQPCRLPIDAFAQATTLAAPPSAHQESVCTASCDDIHTTQERFRFAAVLCLQLGATNLTEAHMNGLIYLIGLIVVIMAILSFFGLH
jgi:hypothetical protein